jgi:hypothetical protein
LESRQWFLMGGVARNSSYLSGVNERIYLQTLFRLLPGQSVVIKAGANTGYASLFLAQAAHEDALALPFPAIEPEPQTF